MATQQPRGFPARDFQGFYFHDLTGFKAKVLNREEFERGACENRAPAYREAVGKEGLLSGAECLPDERV